MKFLVLFFPIVLLILSCSDPLTSDFSQDPESLYSVSIQADGRTWPVTPGIQPEIRDYRVSLPPGTSSFQFQAALTTLVDVEIQELSGIAADGQTRLVVNPSGDFIQIEGLQSGENILTLRVDPKDGTEPQIYTISVMVGSIPLSLQWHDSEGRVREEDLESQRRFVFFLQGISMGLEGVTITIPVTIDDVAQQIGTGQVSNLIFSTSSQQPSITFTGRSTDDGNTQNEEVVIRFGTPVLTGANAGDYLFDDPVNEIRFTVVDDDAPTSPPTTGPQVALSFTQDSWVEGANIAGQVTVSPPQTQSLSVDYSLYLASGLGTIHYYVTSGNRQGTVQIPAGTSSVSFQIPTIDNAFDSQSAELSLSLTGITPSNGVEWDRSEHPLYLTDNDASPVSVLATVDAMNEDGGSADVFFIMGSRRSSDVNIRYSVEGFTDPNDANEQTPSLAWGGRETGTVVIPSGSITSTPIRFTASNNDEWTSFVQGFTLTIEEVSGAGGLVNISTAASSVDIEIVDDEAPRVGISAPSSSVVEGESARFIFSLTDDEGTTFSAPRDTTIRYTVSGSGGATPYSSGSSGEDWGVVGNSLTIAAGTSSATLSIPIVDDAFTESGEYLRVILQGGDEEGKPLVLDSNALQWSYLIVDE